MGIRALCSIRTRMPTFIRVASTGVRCSGIVPRVPCRLKTRCVFSRKCGSFDGLCAVGHS